MTTTRFPAGFLWGAATSAHQIEGSPTADGAGRSIWHRFTHSPGLTVGGETGDVACDHYHRHREDVALMRELGLTAYRFSTAWARVMPEGRGRVNAAGLDFYSRLVDELLAAGITPILTLFHWDLPEALDDRGGWLNPDVAGWFGDYTEVMVKALDDRVPMWATLNEPWVVTDGGYLHGALAPGHENLFEAPIAAHNLLCAHATALEAYRALGRHQVGIAINLEPKYPASESPEDLAATRRADAYMNRQFLDPLFFGRWPEEMREIFGEAWPESLERDLERIRRPIDFLGLNYYTRNVVRHDPQALPVRASAVRQPRSTYTETGWEVYPQGLTDTLVWIRDRYGGVPIVITENGAAFYDPPTAAGPLVEDPLRVAYYREHLAAVAAAIAQGVDVRGYCAWSLLDNFEWSLGYSKRFGLFHVDYATQRRTWKASARYYQRVIAAGGEALGGTDEPETAP
ncbi:MAG TPA: GH1 family beta-glucosidase [Thermoanaerobaculia bacterium]|nr:GH1 family beta-glucosidase [Thermoanaerobaculia bacterium]